MSAAKKKPDGSVNLSIMQTVQRRRVEGSKPEWCAEFCFADGKTRTTGWLPRHRFLAEYMVLLRRYNEDVMDGAGRPIITGPAKTA